jgi:hypothetical protein
MGQIPTGLIGLNKPNFANSERSYGVSNPLSLSRNSPLTTSIASGMILA